MVTMVRDGFIATARHNRQPWPARVVRTPPLRLTRRGRVVATGVSALLMGLLSVTLATAAQATHAGPGSAGQVPARVTMLPGQSLWSVAEAYDPSADPRLVIEQIRRLNSLAGDQVRAGQVLWVPRG